MEPCSLHHWHQSDWPSSVREPSLAGTFPALYTYTELHFTFVGVVCYPSGLVPFACLPTHHIHPIMHHCSGFSGPGQLPGGKGRGGRNEEKGREEESEKKEKVTLTKKLVQWT